MSAELSMCRQNYRCVGGIIGVSAELSACRRNYRRVGGIIGVSAELSECQRNYRSVVVRTPCASSIEVAHVSVVRSSMFRRFALLAIEAF